MTDWGQERLGPNKHRKTEAQTEKHASRWAPSYDAVMKREAPNPFR